MYNTAFKVKYYDIEQELIFKLKNKTELKNNNNNNKNNKNNNNNNEEHDNYYR